MKTLLKSLLFGLFISVTVVSLITIVCGVAIGSLYLVAKAFSISVIVGFLSIIGVLTPFFALATYLDNDV